jgi:hypothetical protein
MKIFIPMRCIRWESVTLPEAPHLRLSTPDGTAGFLTAFTTREQAEREWPGAPIIEAETADKVELGQWGKPVDQCRQ